MLQVKKCLNGHTLHGLVNNAGAAFYGPLMYQPIAEFRRNIDINLIGALQVTQVRPRIHALCTLDAGCNDAAVACTAEAARNQRQHAASSSNCFIDWRCSMEDMFLPTSRCYSSMTQSQSSHLWSALAMQAFLPLLGADKSLQGAPGRIVMVSSVGGKFAAPFIGGYAASKHGLEGMSHSLRRELMLYGIDVIIVGTAPLLLPLAAAGALTDNQAHLERWSILDAGCTRRQRSHPLPLAHVCRLL